MRKGDNDANVERGEEILEQAFVIVMTSALKSIGKLFSNCSREAANSSELPLFPWGRWLATTVTISG